jgi:hypothetical protein
MSKQAGLSPVQADPLKGAYQMNEDKMHKFFGSPEYSNDDNDDDSSSD